MPANQPTSASLQVSPAGVLFVPAGYPGPSIRVAQGALVVDLGFGRQARVSRGGRPRLRRLVICGRSGWWSFEAPAWLAGVGASWAHISRGGRLLGSGPAEISPDHPRLRAAQAVAAFLPVGLHVSRDLVVAKLAGQRRLVEARFAGETRAIDSIARAERLAAAAEEIDQLRVFEADGAAAYFAAWRAHVTVRFPRRDATSIPPHWPHFSGRVSAVSGDAQHATDPANSLLNLAYSLLLIETTIAMRSCGLDPGIPLGLHAFERNRASGALDLLEPGRPIADGVVLDLLANAVFTRRDFVEQPNGTIAISANITRALLDSMPFLASAIAPIVEHAAQTLSDSADLGTLATPLTQANRSRGRNRVRKRGGSAGGSRRIAVEPRCRECGVPLERRGRLLCDTCHALVKRDRLDHYRQSETALRNASGQHPTQRSDVRQKIAESQRAHWEARRANDRAPGFTGRPSEFRRLVLPRIQGVRPAILAQATGLSPGYVAQISAGKRIPHTRHWAALQLAGLRSQG